MTLRVLVVEDEFLIAMELGQLIEEFGHAVVGVADTVEAGLRLAEEEQPDVATVDLRLRGGDDGGELAAQLLDRFGIRSIFVSGNLDKATRDRLAQLKPWGYVGKPMAPHLLADALQSVTNGRDRNA